MASRTFDDCREYFWAGADAVSLGSLTWLASYPGYALAPLAALRIRSVLRRVEHFQPPTRTPERRLELLEHDGQLEETS